MYHLKGFSLLIFAVLIFCTVSLSNAQSSTQSGNSDNTVEYQSVAHFKAVTRKKNYRIGDLISIDVAMFNKSKEPIYFLELKYWGRFSAQDFKDNKIEVKDYAGGRRGPDFDLISSGLFHSEHFIYYLGCDHFGKDTSFQENWEETFNNGHFLFWGRGCIDIKKAGKFLIKARISNHFIGGDGSKKVAVGTIESPPFEINIVEDSPK